MGKFAKGSKRFHARFQDQASPHAVRDALQAELCGLMMKLDDVQHVVAVTGAVQRFKQNDIHGYIKTAAGKTHVVLVCVGANGAFEVRYRMSPRSCHSWAQPQQ